MRGLSRRRFLALAGALPLAAQDATFSGGVSVVSVLVSVRDKQGNIVRDLTQQDFRIEEDGRAQPIRYFSQQTDLALTLGLLVDTSGSQRFVLSDERRASRQFIGRVLREDKDQAFVLHFDGEVELLQDLTSSRDRLQQALQDPSLDQPATGRGRGSPSSTTTRAGTALYDAVLLASDELMRKQAGRKAVIILSDGDDQGSRVTLARSIEAAQRADTLVYSIYFGRDALFRRPTRTFGGPGRGGTPPLIGINVNGRTGEKTLQRLSRETGGSYFHTSDALPLDTIFSRIEEELRSQYNLGYTPPGSAAGYRKVKVTLGRKGLIAQTREGYYAP
jgi:VWFA-related protein